MRTVACAVAVALMTPSVVAAQPQAEATPVAADGEVESPRAQRLIIAGGIVGGTGLLVMTAGLSVLGGIHMGNPGAGKQISGESGEERRLVRTARAMEGLAAAGGSMAIAGIVMLSVGLVRRRRARRARHELTVAPSLGGLVMRGRF